MLTMITRISLSFFKLLFFWVLFFDFGRILFSIHNWEKLDGIKFSEWLGAFYHSIHLDLATAGALSVLPFLFILIYFLSNARWAKIAVYVVLGLEVLLAALIHAGEINAYVEWNHKLTSRVFMHLSNPDEVFRTADHSMTFWFFVYSVLELTFAWRIGKWLFPLKKKPISWNVWIRIPAGIVLFAFFGALGFLFLRGGTQQIPININAAIYTQNPVSNDISINSLYFFGKSYLLYNRTDIDEFMPDIKPEKAEKLVAKMLNYPKEHSNYFLENQRPNIVFVVLEGWSAQAVGVLSEIKDATPNFDKLAQEGYLFTEIYATSGTSEIGNSSIFSGFPGIPEVSISLQPEKHRRIQSLNQDLKKVGYNSSYLFSGDLKYGNIGGYFMDHGFDKVQDENDFPSGLERGKLNFFDADLFDFFRKEINQSKEPFLQCAFTGSTHSPYDHPKAKGKKFTGIEANFMNSIVYSDQSIGKFIADCKKEAWYKNTLFVFVADHGHASPLNQNPSSSSYFHIPLLFWGPALKSEYVGKINSTLGSQADIVSTLLYQMKLSSEAYPYSKDLMNPLVPQFALHTINRGYGWKTPDGNMTYQMQEKVFIEDNFPAAIRTRENERCFAFLTEVYLYYKNL